MGEYGTRLGALAVACGLALVASGRVSRWRLTIRAKLSALVGLAALAFGLLLVEEAVEARGVEVELLRIESRYLPLLELRPELERDFGELRHTYQTAVASRDPATLQEATVIGSRMAARLDDLPAAVDPAAAVALRSAIAGYLRAALDVSRRLLAGETGVEVVAAMRAMQLAHQDVALRIEQVAGFERAQLTAAFESARQAQRTAGRVRLSIALVCTAIVLVLAASIGSGILRSVRQLSTGFARFARGDFRQPVHVSGKDELADVALAANRMAGSLRILDDELRRKQEDLTRTNQELEAFSYSVSHDLRAPLRAIDGFSAALAEDFGDRLPPEATRYLGRVRAGAQRMGGLIDDLLLLSRVTRTELSRERVDVSAMARQIADELRADAPDRQAEIGIEDDLQVEADPKLLRIALENLLGNAWKFTSKKEHATIRVAAEHDGDETVLLVQDNGAGFDMRFAGKLFGAFQRLHPETEFPGTGIGLATVQRIVHRHGGRVWAEAEPGVGATIRLTLGPASAPLHPLGPAQVSAGLPAEGVVHTT